MNYLSGNRKFGHLAKFNSLQLAETSLKKTRALVYESRNQVMPHPQVRFPQDLSKSFLDLLKIVYSASRNRCDWSFSNIVQVFKRPMLDLNSARPLRPSRLNGLADRA
jgi:hypothetical protein